MKSFKQFVRERESIDESRLARGVGLAALGAATIAGLQAGAMHHYEKPSHSQSTTSVETRGGETRTMTSTRTGYAEKGSPAFHSHRGFWDLGPRTVADTAKGKPFESSFSITKKGPSGTVSAYKEKAGGKVTSSSGSYSKTEFSSPAPKNSRGEEIFSPTVSSKSYVQQMHGNIPLTKPASPGQQALGFMGAAAGLASIGAAIRRRK